jgi:hypothetical protein
MDCFVASLLAMTMGHNSAFSRQDLPELCVSHTLENQRAQGMPGARRTRSLVCKGRKHTSSHHRYAEQSGIPCAMVLWLIPRSPRCTGLCSHRRPQLIICELDPSVGRSGPHGFAIRIGFARPATPTRPSHPAPNVRDDRDTPL